MDALSEVVRGRRPVLLLLRLGRRASDAAAAVAVATRVATAGARVD